MAAKLKRPKLDHEKTGWKSWDTVEGDRAVDENHELSTEEPKHPLPTPRPAD